MWGGLERVFLTQNSAPPLPGPAFLSMCFRRIRGLVYPVVFFDLQAEYLTGSLQAVPASPSRSPKIRANRFLCARGSLVLICRLLLHFWGIFPSGQNKKRKSPPPKRD